MQLGFNLSNGITDTLESNSILIYLSKHMNLYTQNVGRKPLQLKGWLKVDKGEQQGLSIKSAGAVEVNE